MEGNDDICLKNGMFRWILELKEHRLFVSLCLIKIEILSMDGKAF
jgi:hypothetical protein